MSLEDKLLIILARPGYVPQKPKVLARRLGVASPQYEEFRKLLKQLAKQGRIEFAKNHTVRPIRPHGSVAGMYRRASAGFGFVRPHLVDGKAGPDILIREGHALDASTGDEVLVRITRKPSRPDLGPIGEVQRVLGRATRQFVGTYFERDGGGLVRVDGTLFSHSIAVGDPGAKGAQPQNKVVIEMIRFPTPEARGEGVITEVLGARGAPGVDTLSIIREYGLPDAFADDALEEARQAAEAFREDDLTDRTDFNSEITITIDPVDARDFDDAISLTRDEKSGHWLLGVHIADVSFFAPPGSALDREARRRATSVYLPQRVIPMFPELISNGLASLQQGKVRYVQSACIDFTPTGQRAKTTFHEAAIRVRKRFTYEQVSAILGDPQSAGSKLDPALLALLLRMRELALLLRHRRLKRGALELNMPETELEYDAQGRVTGGHFCKHDISHQVIEEFMLAANEAVATHLADLEIPFLRRVHPAPDPKKLEAFLEFADSLGYKAGKLTDRFTLQQILAQSADQPNVHAVHYALLRSLKQAVYSPDPDEHYALASNNYCHFTSPIRRYPDLTVHRLLRQWLRTGRAGSDEKELVALGEHCSKAERRSETAERELIKTRLLAYLGERLGLELEIVITGVADYGFFGQAQTLPVEGLVHVSTLTDDYYYYEESYHSLIGRKTKRRFRLGDRVGVQVVRVDLQKRQLDFRVVPAKKKT